MTAAEEFQATPEKAMRVLNGLSVATKTYRLYPNPLEQSAFGRAMQMVREGLADSPTLRLHVLPDRFSIAGNDFGSDQETIAELAAWLFQRGVTELHIRGEPRASELVAFAELVSSEGKDIDEQGGPKSFLSHRETTAIHVVDRKLAVGEFTPLALERIPDRLRSLLEDQMKLAGEITTESSPQEAYERLRELLRAGKELGLEENTLNSGIADVVASMEPGFRADLLEIAIDALPDEFASLIVSQLSDGEIAESLTALSAKRPIDLIMAMAHDVVEHAGGRRIELPIIVGKRMLDIGLDSQDVNQAFDSAKAGKDGSLLIQSTPADALRLSDALGELRLDELRAEAKSPAEEVNEETGIATLQGVLRSSEDEKDFDETVAFIGEAIDRAVSEENRKRYSRLIELLVGEAVNAKEESRRRRLEESVSKVASSDRLIAALLKEPGGDSNPFSNRMLELLGGHVVPTLVGLLADEVDRTRRKVLIEMLVATAPFNPNPVVEGLNDPRWYVVRNFAMVLGRIRANQAIPALEKLMHFGDPRVRREAVRAAASTRGAAALPSLIQALTDPDEVVRLQSIAAIGAIQDGAATEALIQFASRRNRSLAEMKEVLTSLKFQSNQTAAEYLRKTAQRWWPPTSSTRQLAKFAKDLLGRPSPQSLEIE